MYLLVCGYLMGICFIFLLTKIPNFYLLFLLLLCLLIIAPRINKKLFLFILGVIFGVISVAYTSYKTLSWVLDKNLENRAILITGEVSGLPKFETHLAHFDFNLQTINSQKKSAKISLAWYNLPEGVFLHAGDQWQLSVRLKRPHGQLNPGGFDYEAWLFSKKIRATGYVVASSKNQKLNSNFLYHPINLLRQYLQAKLSMHLSNQTTAGLIIALIMGAQNQITSSQWQVMRNTGTNHLMAIAGVHLGFVAGFIYFLCNFIWRRLPKLMLKIPAHSAASIAAWIVALFYSALAGFSLPTQRALLMFSMLIFGILWKKEWRIWQSIFLALLIVLILDPLVVLTVSFWLSFAAVFAILFGISGRLNQGGIWWKYGRVQWVITLGLIPLTFILFQQTSITAFIANLFAVPAVGFAVLPFCFLGTFLIFLWPEAGHLLLILSAQILEKIWWILSFIANIKWGIWQPTTTNIWMIIAALFGILVLLLPKGIPGRWLGCACFLPLIFYKHVSLAPGFFKTTVLDVGQGLAIAVQTRNHILIYDTGPPVGPVDDTGSRIIIPFLNAMGMRKIDRLIISHGDSDHSGGAKTLIKTFAINDILTSAPEQFTDARQCQQGQIWIWDDVVFEMLYPAPEFFHLKNNSSCVLKIGQGRNSVLLTGDIERLAESIILQQPNKLSAKVLVAPHHGSATSSTVKFIQAINPELVIFSMGYQNKFHFPNRKVVERYINNKTQLDDTAKSGAISFILGKNSELKWDNYRRSHWRIWY